MASLKGIYRHQRRSFEGWLVKIKRRRREHLKYFSDVPRGPVEALRAALMYRDALLRRLGPPTHVTGNHARNRSGAVGVCREISLNSAGNLAENWVASWIDASGKRRRRAYSVNKYGEAEAKQRAVATCKEGVRRTLAERRRSMVGDLDDLGHFHMTVSAGP